MTDGRGWSHDGVLLMELVLVVMIVVLGAVFSIGCEARSSGAPVGVLNGCSERFLALAVKPAQAVHP